jgi:protein-L-isoaspartate(D-aspartate) O-methyltransferase|tara:strand:+ start:698 stop:1345 length:648 start_codon:yes stop_codon:yes gene_type:complete
MTTPANRARLILSLRSAGITDISVLSAVERVPRELFVPEPFRDQSYEDTALPIGYGQTLSQPYIVAFMVASLELNKTLKVLEIGTGSGYHCSVLSYLCRRVYTVERHRPLLANAEQKFSELQLHNISTRAGDGMKGWPEQAPFDRISVSASSSEIPQNLLEQLAIGGIMILPVSGVDRKQVLKKISRTDSGFETQDLIEVRFVPLLPGLARDKSA